MTTAHLVLEVESSSVGRAVVDLDRLPEAAERAERGTDKLRSGFGRAEKGAGAFASALRVVLPLLTAVTGALSVGALGHYADAWSDMQSRVGAAIRDMEAAPTMMQRLTDVANASYSPLQQTVEIYGRNVAVLRDLGRGATEAADFTEALNHALVTTATKGQDADVVLNALSRSIAIGALRSNEFETIMSRSPRVLEAIAEELGTTVTGLRAFAQEGRVTGEVIVDALVGSLEQLREEAGEMPATIGDAFTRVQTNFTALIGTLDHTYQISGRVAERILSTADAILSATEPAAFVIDLLADNFDRVTLYATAFATMMAVNYVSSIVTAANVTAVLTGGLTALRWAMARIPFLLVVMAVTELIVQFNRLVQATGGWGNALEALGDLASGVWQGIVTTAQAIPVGLNAVWLEVQASFLLMIQQLQAAWNDFLSTFERPALTVTIGGETHEIIGGLDLSGWRTDLDATGDSAARLRDRAAELRVVAGDLASQGFGQVGEAVRRLNTALNETGDETRATDDAIRRLDEALGAADSGMAALGDSTAPTGSAMSAANDNATRLAGGMNDLERAGQRTASSLADAFVSVLDGSKTAVQALTDLLKQLSRLALNNAFQALFVGGPFGGGGGMSGMVGGVMSSFKPGLGWTTPSFAGGGFTGYGARSGGIDGKGGFPAILHPNETVIDHSLGQRHISHQNQDGQERHRESAPVYVTIQARDVESFRQSRAQVAADIGRAVALGRRVG